MLSCRRVPCVVRRASCSNAVVPARTRANAHTNRRTRSAHAHALARTCSRTHSCISGAPVGQFYGLGDKWIQFNRKYICGVGSPCIDITSKDAWRYYTVGPPYILHVADWRKLAQAWVDFVPKVYEEYPNLLAEMYAYCLAAAHHELPHARIDSYMVSNVGAYGEAWDFVDRMPEVCRPGLPIQWTDPAKLPTFAHLCQGYRMGSRWKFGKRAVSKNLFTNCEASYLPQPPTNASQLPKEVFTTMIPTKERPKLSKEEKAVRDVKRNAFMVCIATTYVNRAMRRHKEEFCPEHQASQPAEQRGIT